MKTCSRVVLYESDNKEKNILNYYNSVDKVYIFDNYVESRETIIEDILSKHSGRVEGKVKFTHFHNNIGHCKALNHGMK